MTAAIIIARGGSKRLPRKNVKEFCGLPLVAWAIIQAKTSILIDDVFVSTDDNEIMNIAREYGAHVIVRPDWPDADQAAGNRPFLHAIKEIYKMYGDDFNEVLTILPTTPLNLPGDFDSAIKIYRNHGCDRVSPLIPRREAVLYKKMSPTKARFDIFKKNYYYLGEGGGWVVTSPKWYMTYASEMSDLDADLNNMDNWTCRETSYWEQQYWQYADVDTLEEFEFAEVVMEHFILKGRGAEVYFDYLKTNKKFIGSVSIPESFGNSAQTFGGD